MPLSFNANVPQASQTVASTQAPILTNFQSIDAAFNGQGGGGTGGGNFSTYSFQNVTSSFVSKPTNPVGILYTIQDSSGNPQLAWINNVNAQGAGPYTGIQITGGGSSTAAWVTFTATTGAFSFTPSSTNSYNIASVTKITSGVYTIAFSRNFSSTVYCPIASVYVSSLTSVDYFFSNQLTSSITITVMPTNSNINVSIFGIT